MTAYESRIKENILETLKLLKLTWNVHPITRNLHFCGLRGHCCSCSIICIVNHHNTVSQQKRATFIF